MGGVSAVGVASASGVTVVVTGVGGSNGSGVTNVSIGGNGSNVLNGSGVARVVILYLFVIYSISNIRSVIDNMRYGRHRHNHRTGSLP